MADILLEMQKAEASEHKIYSALAKRTKDAKNRKILEEIAKDELRHYEILKALTKKDVGPDSLKVAWYSFVASTLGLTFGLKLMENDETRVQRDYDIVLKSHPELKRIMEDEERHEKDLIGMLAEERLEYASSVVLGLNDAIVEFTGTLAGLTFAIGDARIIGITGLIMGVAASLSMGASSYLSSKEDGKKDPVKSFIYTAATYLLTVAIIVSPYFILGNAYLALGVLFALTMLIIAAYSFYITTAKNQSFWSKFLEMAGLSLGVAIISFLFGLALKQFVGTA